MPHSISRSVLSFMAAACVMALATNANAVFVDFTDTAQFPAGPVGGPVSGVFGGVTFTLSSSPNLLNFNDTVNNGGAAECSLLACLSDGAGIGDDEIGPGQVLYVDISEAVAITNILLFDLYSEPGGQDAESALVDFGDDGSDDEQLFATEPFSTSTNGFANFVITNPNGVTTRIAFRVGVLNDGQGVEDYALAGLEFSPVPLPAALPLFAGGLGGLGLLGWWRRRKAATC